MVFRESMKNLLTIGGHDLSNGAGITKDLEVFSAYGCHGLSVPTSFVVQGPGGVSSVDTVSIGLFAEMLQRAGEDFALSGVKIGALADELHLEIVAEFLDACVDAPVVLDPIVQAKNGSRLITDEGITAMVERLLPLVTCLTPNLEEAGILLGKKVDGVRAMGRAAKDLAAMGPHSVVVKGGHMSGDPVDVLFDGADVLTHTRKRVGRTVHGTGCLFSSCLLSFLAYGFPPREAFMETERAMDRLIEGSTQPAEGGYFYAAPGADAGLNGRKWEVFQAMVEAAGRLAELDVGGLIPARGMGMGYAALGALTPDDVATFPGGISLRRGRLHIGTPGFGVFSDAAAVCLACIKHYPFLRSAALIKYDGASVERANQKGLSAVRLDKSAASGKEGPIIESALKRTAGPPDLVYDPGSGGREPLIRLFARSPRELIEKMETIRPCTTN